MSYIIYTNSGTVLTTVATGKLNTNTTSLTLVGRNVNNYGQFFNQNFVDLLTNFASPSYLPPQHPIEGQLWYDTTVSKLKVYDSSTGFDLVNAAIISDTQPIGQVPGEFWYDPTEETINFLNADGQYASVHTFPKNELSGWVHPSLEILDENTNTTQVTLLKSNGNIVGALTTASFVASFADSTGVFSRAGETAFEVVSGLTIIGDVKVTGTVYSNASTLISLSELKSVVAASTDFADFKTRIAAL